MLSRPTDLVRILDNIKKGAGSRGAAGPDQLHGSSVEHLPVLILMGNQSGAPKESKVVSIPQIPVFAVTIYLL